MDNPARRSALKSQGTHTHSFARIEILIYNSSVIWGFSKIKIYLWNWDSGMRSAVIYTPAEINYNRLTFSRLRRYALVADLASLARHLSNDIHLTSNVQTVSCRWMPPEINDPTASLLLLSSFSKTSVKNRLLLINNTAKMLKDAINTVWDYNPVFIFLPHRLEFLLLILNYWYNRSACFWFYPFFFI